MPIERTAEQERAAIVAWLRGNHKSLRKRAAEETDGDNDREHLAMLVGQSAAYAAAAYEIERGDHHSGETNNG